jgi:putative heme-binding domain-containing protein
LKQQLEIADGENAQVFVTALLRTKVTFPGFFELMMNKAGNDTTARLDVIAPLLSPKAPTPPDMVQALVTIATSPAEQPESRARALRMLNSVAEKNFSRVCDAFVPLAAAEQQGALRGVWEEFTRDSRHAQKIRQFSALARDKDPARRNLGATVLVNIVTSTVIKDNKAKQSAQSAIDSLWKNPDEQVSLLRVIGAVRATQFAPRAREQLNSTNTIVAQAAQLTLADLDAGRAGAGGNKLIGEMTYDDVVKLAIATSGDAKIGAQLFLKQGCIVCHTVSPKEPPKGPMLGGIATRYSRAELCESILKPSAKIAQGFETQFFRMKNGDDFEGFVVKEGGDSVEVRSISGPSTILEKADIAERQRRAQSMMPEGIVANITPAELAALLAYLESTSAN